MSWKKIKAWIFQDAENVVEKDMTIMSEKEASERIYDLKVFGDTDAWKLICKAASQAEGWYKTTKAMEIPHVGCLIQTETHIDNGGDEAALSQALTFVPGVSICEKKDDRGECVNRFLYSSSYYYKIPSDLGGTNDT